MDSVRLTTRRGGAPVSGREGSRSLRWLTNAYLFSATLKPTVCAVVAGGSLAGMPFASMLVSRLTVPYRIVLGLVTTVRGIGKQFAIGEFVLGRGMLLLVLRAYEALE